MSCDFCDKKFGLLTKKAEKTGKCWACQRSSCSKCSPLYDGRELGWVAMHPCCPKCVEALERQKKKTQSMLLQVSQKEAISKAVGDLPAWSLPPSSSSSEPPKVAVAAASDAGDSASIKADNLALSRLKPVGSSREDAKRASRVLLQAVIENYADRDSYQTPQKKDGGGSSSDELSESSDLDTPIVQVASPSTTELKTPVSAIRTADQQRRLSRGVLASLESLSQAAASMNASYSTPKQDEKLAEELATPSHNLPVDDDEFERELKTLDLPPMETPLKNPLLNLSSVELGHVSPNVKETQRMEAELFDGEEYRAEVGEDLSDAALNAQINSLDSALLTQVQQDPVSHIAEALTTVASSSKNQDAAIAMHEDLMEVLQEVRREERDAKMVAMLDDVESRLKESLVKVSTPKVKRKQFANNLYQVGQNVSARNTMDNCWYTAKIVDIEEDGQCKVQFVNGRTQMCSQSSDIRRFLVGNNVLALYRPDGLGLMQEAIVDYIQPPGLYHIRFLSDGSKQTCAEADVRPIPLPTSPRVDGSAPVAAHVAAPIGASVPVQPVVAETRKATNPNMVVSGRDRVIRDIQSIEFWVNEQKNLANQCGVVKQSDRKTLLVSAQLLGHARKIFDQATIEPFELRLQDTSKGEVALYTKLQQSVILAADALLQKLGKLSVLLSHPKAAERLESVGKKVRQIKDFVNGSNVYLAQI